LARLDWLWFLPRIIWLNAGFASLRAIRPHLDSIEPRYDPTVVPLRADGDNNVDSPALNAVLAPPVKYPTKYYSVADYHALYKSGELTPTAVVKALLPLIRRDLSSPGKHSIAFIDSRVHLILAAAEESTRRYKENRPLGLFDGVPTAVKDEFDLDGYRTNIGSLNDYTSEAKPGDPSITNWCVRQLEKAGAIIVGKLSMHEFGLGTDAVSNRRNALICCQTLLEIMSTMALLQTRITPSITPGVAHRVAHTPLAQD
jgi:hypothetical protein